MAICTTNFALRNLFLDRGPTPTTREHVGDVSLLVRKVVKLKHDDVGLAAVDAWVSSQVFDHPTLVIRALCGRIAEKPRLLRLAILPVVLAPIRGEALTTPRLQLRLTAPHRWERVKRLQLATFRARSHARERADFSASDE